ncbi:trafficking kinesin-binding protein 1 isoform X2 [Dunckerocampus dactyliophorus]|uniref:trafficking kinesin-binding protein 1 isoform X2 n=1 Tax=Dunckerocampus dactyliophorus TaxID=161453 RepID=UPI002406C19E|nr:trafficking kinesin-binding protein 1 isoform X2 [Dunckerocampus dactyliophorus]
MDSKSEGSFSMVTMEVWISSGSEEEEENGGAAGIGLTDKASNNNNNNNNNNLCREVTQVLCSDRVGQVTKTYHDIKAVTHLLEEKERDLELAARIGQSLLKQNQELTTRNGMLDEQLEIAKEEIAQLRHELSMRDDLLQFYASTEEIENAESQSSIKKNESSSSLSNFVHYDFLQQKLKCLEEENRKLRLEASELSTETSNYEEQEQELMMVCVEELSSVNKQVVDLSDELARKVEDSLRQQEEISSLLAQIVDLQARCKCVTNDNEELNQHLSASRESNLKLQSQLKDLQDKYSECKDMLHEAREDNKNLRNKSLPNSTVQRYTALASVLPMDSLAAEIEGTFRKGLDTPSSSEYNICGPKRLGQPGTPGGQDLEAALRSLSARQQNHSSERPFFDVERERKLLALAANREEDEGSSGFLTPNDSLASSSEASTGTDYSNRSSRHSCGSVGSRSYLPDRLQIVKPLEGSVTLHQWQQLAKPNLGGILHPRPGVLTKDFRELEVDIQHVYSLNDLEEDEPDLSLLSGATSMVSSSSGLNLPQTSPTPTITTCQVPQPSLHTPSCPVSHHSISLPFCHNCEHVSTSPVSHKQHFGLAGSPTTNISWSSLGLMQLLQERGISASSSPHRHIHIPSTEPWRGAAIEQVSCTDTVGKSNTFSLNLVEKLQSLGMHRVAARGMTCGDAPIT